MKDNVIFGRQIVIEYLESKESDSIKSIHIANNSHGKVIDEIVLKAKQKNIKTIFIDKKKLDRDFPNMTHQGVILKLSANSSQSSSDYRDLLNHTFDNKGLIIFLDQLTDPHNIGSIIRTAEALGATGIIMPKANTPEINATIVKTSAGATAHLPIFKVSNGASFLEEAKKSGIWIIGSSDKATTSLAKAKEYLPAVLVIGNEGTGMRRLTTDKCDITVKIEMQGKINSLNASVAAGILIHEILK